MVENAGDGIMLKRRDVNVFSAGCDYGLDDHIKRNRRGRSIDHLLGRTMEQTTNEYFGMDRYGDFKRIVADEVAEFLENFQNRLAAVDERAIEKKLASSEKDMNVVANETLYRVQKAVGLRK